uniref:Platelet endothelial aggregation receptor 1-like n=1 Tax=Crassostrea virginica TaxID=6565 RepID=A0A8B8AUQ3_CRAVI|nr:platelet endothelial aggregation receptor 1-like [Crassostrea virginica]
MLKGTVFLCYVIGGVIIPFDVLTYENLALRKSTWQLHPLPLEGFSAERAVDGQKSNLAEFGGECTVSAYGKLTAEWRVELGKILSIHHIVIHYATSIYTGVKDDSYSAHFLGFSVYISNTTFKRDGVLCFKDVNYTRSTIPNPVNITCPYHGRYVIYYNNRTQWPFPAEYSRLAYNCICEVEVYGCRKQGRYGENCAISCPTNCLDSVCHVVNGTCFGCSMGYKGEMCDLECPFGFYGHDCLENCSANCGVSRLCDRKTGNCMQACQTGWKGNRCIRECDGGFFGHNCTELCGECFEKERCHHVNGSCLKGCAYGYSGINCTNDEGLHISIIF